MFDLLLEMDTGEAGKIRYWLRAEQEENNRRLAEYNTLKEERNTLRKRREDLKEQQVQTYAGIEHMVENLLDAVADFNHGTIERILDRRQDEILEYFDSEIQEHAESYVESALQDHCCDCEMACAIQTVKSAVDNVY